MRRRVIFRAQLTAAPRRSLTTDGAGVVVLRVTSPRPPALGDATQREDRLDLICRDPLAARAAQLAVGDWLFATSDVPDDAPPHAPGGVEVLVVRELARLDYRAPELSDTDAAGRV